MDSHISKTLGDFKIIREIGRGGMGVIYEAEQQSLKRRVAIKVLNPALTLSEKSVSRFRREAESAAKLDHPNIVNVHSFGQEDETYYYAMEFIDGKSLDAILDKAKQSYASAAQVPDVSTVFNEKSTVSWNVLHAMTNEPEHESVEEKEQEDEPIERLEVLDEKYFHETARMMIEAAQALDYAHKSGIVHRDIKPSNLMLTKDGKLVITDFGLAREVDGKKLTITGDLMGTPSYMSPEQTMARGLKIDHRTDIYSLGVTLYEMLTLNVPFDAEDSQTLMNQIAFKEPRDPRKLNRGLPRDLAAITLKAMEKDPDRRYQLAGELGDDIRRFVKDEPILARPPGVLRKGVRIFVWYRAACFATILVFLAFFLGRFAWQSREPEPSEKTTTSLLSTPASKTPIEKPGQLPANRTDSVDLEKRPDVAEIHEDLDISKELAVIRKRIATVRQVLEEKLNRTTGRLISVRKDGKGNFTNVQEAIDAASPGDSIEIQDSERYTEEISISKDDLVLRAKTGETAVVDGRRAQACIRIANARGTVIHGMTLVNGGIFGDPKDRTGYYYAAIMISDCQDTIVARSAFLQNVKGVYSSSSIHTAIIDNIIQGSFSNAIFSTKSKNEIIAHNLCKETQFHCFFIGDAESTLISNNVISGVNPGAGIGIRYTSPMLVVASNVLHHISGVGIDFELGKFVKPKVLNNLVCSTGLAGIRCKGCEEPWVANNLALGTFPCEFIDSPRLVLRDNTINWLTVLMRTKENVRIDHNCFFRRGLLYGYVPIYGIEELERNSGCRFENCFFEFPSFEDTPNDFRLKPDSPLKGTASDGGDIGVRFEDGMPYGILGSGVEQRLLDRIGPSGFKPLERKKFVVVKQDGTGDLKTLYEAVLAVGDGGTIEIADNGPYKAWKVQSPRTGITIRGANGYKPIIIRDSAVLVSCWSNWRLSNLILANPSKQDKSYSIGIVTSLLGGVGQLTEERNLVTIEDCAFHGFIAAIVPSGLNVEFKISNCTFVDNSWGICPQGACLPQQVLVQNCTFFNSPILADTREIITGMEQPIIRIENSIIANTKEKPIFQAETIPGWNPIWQTDYNCYFSPGPFFTDPKAGRTLHTLENWRLITKSDVNSLASDPMFLNVEQNDFRLAADSACRGKASDGGDLGVRWTDEQWEIYFNAIRSMYK